MSEWVERDLLMCTESPVRNTVDTILHTNEVRTYHINIPYEHTIFNKPTHSKKYDVFINMLGITGIHKLKICILLLNTIIYTSIGQRRIMLSIP